MSGAARTVWVTGAASGMGAAHARRFAELGDRVGCWDVQADALDGVVEEIRAAGGVAKRVVADITDAEAVVAGAAGLREARGSAAVCSDEARYVIGSSIVVDGGSIIQEPHGIDLYGRTERRA